MKQSGSDQAKAIHESCIRRSGEWVGLLQVSDGNSDGVISKAQIDLISESQKTWKNINGLRQKEFEFFVQPYGNPFEEILPVTILCSKSGADSNAGCSNTLDFPKRALTELMETTR